MKVIETREIDGQKYDLMEAARAIREPCSHCVFIEEWQLKCCSDTPRWTCLGAGRADRRFWRKHKETT